MATVSNKFSNYFLRFRTMLFHELSHAYKPKLNQSKDELYELIREKSAKALQSELARKLRVAKDYYKLEMSPPRMDEMKRLQEDLALTKAFIKNNCYKNLTVRQAWLLFLIGTEVGLWFFLGETIGKMHLVGYKV
ncbi:ATP synthase subunit g, mitochondrial-like [Maniola jurtina]|uniref:ATP synthase subunit g, mitochondrial-like n=1 Tax=Maniola jurtina TaxID=191418 RepID=UPI001E68721B|nr:ATP synthase subunit g, mitochondrial-like [Maniola jurtina]